MHVSESDLVQNNDELDRVGVGLLPKRFFTLAKQVVEERGDSVRQSITIEIVVKGIVGPF